MAGHYVAGGSGKSFDFAKGIKHGADVQYGYERAVRLQIFVIMAGIGREYDVAPLRVDAHDLQTRRMTGRQMQRQPRRHLHVALVQFEPALEVEPHYSDYILYFKGVAEVWVPYIAPGSEGEF